MMFFMGRLINDSYIMERKLFSKTNNITQKPLFLKEISITA